MVSASTLISQSPDLMRCVTRIVLANGEFGRPMREDLQALLKEIMNQPRDVLDRVKKILTG